MSAIALLGLSAYARVLCPGGTQLATTTSFKTRAAATHMKLDVDATRDMAQDAAPGAIDQDATRDMAQSMAPAANSAAHVESRTVGRTMPRWMPSAASGNVQLGASTEEPINLMQKVKDAGVAGIVSYMLWELLFWGVSAPVCIIGKSQHVC